MSSGICKNEEVNKKDTSRKSTIFNFWIYLGLIILGLIFVILIIYLIYSLLSSNNNNNNNCNCNNTTSKITTPTFKTRDLTSFQNIPNMTTISIPPPLPEITTETISINKKPFLTTLMSKTTDTTDKAINSLVSPLYNRNIPIKTTGGFRCMNRRRF
jgi:heme/copper-type cytochrome/quinol oxidase subunit 1